MSATSSYEIIMTLFMMRAEINVQVHLLDITCRHYHTTVKGIELDTKETNFPMNVV
jgi:hypothetical protein